MLFEILIFRELRILFCRPCSTGHCIYVSVPPLEPGQNPSQNQKSDQKSGQKSGQQCGQKSGQHV